MKLKVEDCAQLAMNSYAIAKATSKGQSVDGVSASFNKSGAQAVITKDNILLIPGTNELSDWFKNFDVLNILGKRFTARDTSKSTSGATYHAGFWRHAAQLHRFAKENRAEFIIGHSLGAATAQILGVALNVHAVGFASPRVKRGNRKVRNEENILNICRADDLVTRVPPSETGFRRLGKTIRLMPPKVEKGIDHSMKDYMNALSFEAFDHQLPKSWG